jgi:tetratricopeptide (TPR) repeat protein
MGDMHGAEQTLREIAGHFEKKAVTAICGCHPFETVWSSDFLKYSYLNNENALRDVVAFAVVFRKSEIHCIPRELQYEMFRSTRADMSQRSLIDRWMDWAVVDSLVYMCFLQYKVYVHFQKREEQQQALIKLAKGVDKDVNLKHKETALNLLGQCMEQENRPAVALHYYILSLRIRPRNNAAIWHILIKLNKEFSKKEGRNVLVKPK